MNDMQLKLKDLNETRNALASEDPLGQVPRLEDQIEHLKKMIQEGNDNIDEAKESLNQAAHERKELNALFQRTVSEQRSSQQVLTKAKEVLESVFAKKSFIQAEPAATKQYKQNSGGSNVIEMINNIIKQSVQLVEKSIVDENKLQVVYQGLVMSTNEEIEKTQAQVDERTIG